MILDTNAFIEPANRFYSFDICPGYWDFVMEDFESSNAISIKHVRDEVLVGEDKLADWMKESINKVHFYDCAGDEAVVAEQRRVAEYVMHTYDKPNVINDFLATGVADSWIVAYALAHGGTVVTQETHKRKGKKVSLVDVCKHFGIHQIDVFEFLRIEKARFVYQKREVA